MKKKFAIFCDGTWMSLRNADVTNVVKLAKCVAPESNDGVPQMVYYDEGVGIGSDVAGITDSLTKYMGGAFGRGLDAKIEQAYQFLVLNFRPGDEIYVFGFSRGAYTARSLCGLIRKCGIVTRDKFATIPEAMERYRNPIDPNDPEMIQFRTENTHPLAAGDEDNVGLKITSADQDNAASKQTSRSDLYQYRSEKTYRLMYAGIWDTVGQLGVPRRFDLLGNDRSYDFHDTKASSLISSIRHAVAANEQRELYDVTLFDNFEQLNGKWAERTGWNIADPDGDRFVPYAQRPYQQCWFPGDHGSVGGGYHVTALSDKTLLWIAEGAEWAGLKLLRDNESPLVSARTHALSTGTLGIHSALALPRGDYRAKGPLSLDEVSDVIWDRARRDKAYQPANLVQLLYQDQPERAAPKGFPTA